MLSSAVIGCGVRLSDTFRWSFLHWREEAKVAGPSFETCTNFNVHKLGGGERWHACVMRVLIEIELFLVPLTQRTAKFLGGNFASGHHDEPEDPRKENYTAVKKKSQRKVGA